MAEISVTLKSLRIAPRKVRLLADLIRGKKVKDAEQELLFYAKKSAHPLHKLLGSAVQNARHNVQVSNPEETLYVKSITVDEGRPFKRFMPRAHGRASMFKKRTSHITLVLDEI